MAHPEYSEDLAGAGTGAAVVSSFMGWIGAGCSLALVAGTGWWIYGVAMRDAHGIPVIAAIEGPARLAPEDPGGFEAPHKGLSVTEISSNTDELTPPEEITLAPPPVTLVADDQPATEIAPKVEARSLRDAVASALMDAGVLVPPVAADPMPAPAPMPAPVPVAAPAALVQPAVLTNAGPRPAPRPMAGVVTRAAYSAPVESDLEPALADRPLDIDPADLSAETRLVQLGAYDSVATAMAEWDRAASRFSLYFQDKSRVIEKTERTGKVFYRLRVHGFDDMADARRFCSALSAGGADCIPVKAR